MRRRGRIGQEENYHAGGHEGVWERKDRAASQRETREGGWVGVEEVGEGEPGEGGKDDLDVCEG